MTDILQVRWNLRCMQYVTLRYDAIVSRPNDFNSTIFCWILTALKQIGSLCNQPTIYSSSGSEGKAGMAALHLENDRAPTPQVMHDIFHHCQENLPSYARPIFIRFPKEQAITVTLKQQKTHLRKEGFHPENVEDPLFYYDEMNKTYSPLTVETYPKFLAKSRLWADLVNKSDINNYNMQHWLITLESSFLFIFVSVVVFTPFI